MFKVALKTLHALVISTGINTNSLAQEQQQRFQAPLLFSVCTDEGHYVTTTLQSDFSTANENTKLLVDKIIKITPPLAGEYINNIGGLKFSQLTNPNIESENPFFNVTLRTARELLTYAFEQTDNDIVFNGPLLRATNLNIDTQSLKCQ